MLSAEEILRNNPGITSDDLRKLLRSQHLAWDKDYQYKGVRLGPRWISVFGILTAPHDAVTDVMIHSVVTELSKGRRFTP